MNNSLGRQARIDVVVSKVFALVGGCYLFSLLACSFFMLLLTDFLERFSQETRQYAENVNSRKV